MSPPIHDGLLREARRTPAAALRAYLSWLRSFRRHPARTFWQVSPSGHVRRIA